MIHEKNTPQLILMSCGMNIKTEKVNAYDYLQFR